MDILVIKNEIIQRINQTEDQEVLQKVIALLEENKSWSELHDFDTEFAKGMSVDEARAHSQEFIGNLPWKK